MGQNQGWAWAVWRAVVNIAVTYGVILLVAFIFDGGPDFRSGLFIGVPLGWFIAAWLRLVWSGRWNEPVRLRRRS